jgi:hypothetical protein
LEPGRGHHLEGLPWARYPVSKTGGSSGLGGSTPSPSASGGMAELERQRVASAQAATTARRFESCCLRHRPVAQRTQSSGFRPHVRPFESGRGVHVVPQVPIAEWRSEPRESNARVQGRSLVAGPRPPTSRARLTARRTHVFLCDVVQWQDARLLTGRRWFESSRRSLATPRMPRSSNGRGRRSLTPEARVRFPLGVLHSTPSDASGDATRLSAGRGGFDSRRGRSSRRSSVVSTTLLPWRHGGSTPPGETASHG